MVGTEAVRGRTTQPGFRNPNVQVVVRDTGFPGTDRGQRIYVMRCEDPACTCGGRLYGVNGSNCYECHCPEQGGTDLLGSKEWT